MDISHPLGVDNEPGAGGHRQCPESLDAVPIRTEMLPNPFRESDPATERTLNQGSRRQVSNVLQSRFEMVPNVARFGPGQRLCEVHFETVSGRRSTGREWVIRYIAHSLVSDKLWEASGSQRRGLTPVSAARRRRARRAQSRPR
jgi:hypothetical protein